MSAQDLERGWWGDCGNTFHEEQKQMVYAIRMGLYPLSSTAHPPSYDVAGARILDVGGGPVSLLLKCVNRAPGCRVIDPCSYPAWIAYRYAACGIEYEMVRGEDCHGIAPVYDEAWCYNVLQHVDDPELIAANMRSLSDRVRVFEWIDIPPYPGHPQLLTAQALDTWFGVEGTVEDVDVNGAVGRAWYTAPGW